MKHCPVCKKELRDSARFCPFCMTSLIEKDIFPPAKPFFSIKRKHPLVFFFLPLSGVFFCALFLLILFLPSRDPDPSPLTQGEATEEIWTSGILEEETKSEETFVGKAPSEDKKEDLPSTEDHAFSPPEKTDSANTDPDSTPTSTTKDPFISTPTTTTNKPTNSTPTTTTNKPTNSTPPPTSGSISDNAITWTFRENILTFEGAGSIPGSRSSEDTPWAALRESVEKVVLKEGITSVGNLAFQAFYNLEEVSFPASLRTIGDAAFEDCYLSKVVLPEGITSIGDAAFSFNPQLEEVVLPGSLEVVPYWAFGDCSKLRKVVLSEGIRELGEGAFIRAPLEELYLPKSLKIIGLYAFCIDDPKALPNIKTKVYYKGSQAEFQKITVRDDNDLLGEYTAFYYNASY